MKRDAKAIQAMQPQSSLTDDLAAFAASFRVAPDEALQIAKNGIIDAIGLTILAHREPVVQAARKSMGVPLASSGSSSILFSVERTKAADAAFINATAAHAFAMDDVAWGCHPSAILFPALLAAGEMIHASGPDLLRAWIVGYEVLAELNSREPDSLHATGWHPSGLLGPIAVAAAVCNLRGANAEQARHAMGIAVSMTGGLQVNFGTATKAIHAGRISSAGILAADLAANGVTAASDAIERPTGFLRTISPKGRADISSPSRLGFDPAQPNLRLLESGISIKKYPLCYSLHRVADAAIDLSRTKDFNSDDIDGIDIYIGRRQAEMAHYMQPTSSLEARYSVPFSVACGLVASAAGFAQLDQDFIQSERVKRLVSACTIHQLDDVNTEDPVFSNADRVTVRLDDGSVLDSGERPYARGHASMPMTSDELRLKFVDCASAGGVADASGLYEKLADFASMSSVAELAPMINLPVAS